METGDIDLPVLLEMVMLRALAKRMPPVAHRKRNGAISDVALDDVAVGDTLVVYPHDICPVDGTVVEGNGVMNKAFLTGEPFEITKAPGSAVISGDQNAPADNEAIHD